MKYMKIMKVIGVIVSILFILQSFNVIRLVPLDSLLKFLNFGNNPFNVFLSVFVGIFIITLFMLLISSLYSIGIKGRVVSQIQRNVFNNWYYSGLTIVFTLFSYAILILLGVMRKDNFNFLNLFAGLYILLTVVMRPSNRTANKINIVGESMYDENRVFWLNQITGINKIDSFNGEKGERLYFESNFRMIGFIIIILFLIFFFNPFNGLNSDSNLYMPGSSQPVNLNIITYFFAVIFLFGLLWSVGMILSKRVRLFSNCISIPLPTFSSQPLYTLILPNSSIFVSYKDIKKGYIKEIHLHKGRTKYYLYLQMNNDSYLELSLYGNDVEKISKILKSKVKNSAELGLTK